MEMRWGIPALIVMVVAIVLAVATYVGYTDYGLGMSSDSWQRTVFARGETKVVVRQLQLPQNVSFQSLVVVKHTDGRMVLCGTYGFVGADHDINPPTPFYATGPLVVAFGTDTAEFKSQFDRYCKENGDPV